MTRPVRPRVAYFSMEIAVDARVPTYSGGLGVLAGDLLRAAADLEFPIIGVTLLQRQGYFHQELDHQGNQHERPETWRVEDCLELLSERCTVLVEGREVQLRCWVYHTRGHSGFDVPVYFLDSDVDGNAPFDRTLTGTLYGGDQRYRLCQEQVLGAGGLRMVRALGLTDLPVFHINEGHGSMVFPELVLEASGPGATDPWQVLWGTARCVFTTHTPIAAGHDSFSLELAEQVVGAERLRVLQDLGSCKDSLNLTIVALQLSGYTNAVARSHRVVTSAMFPEYAIDSVTNGVHSATWTSPPFKRLFDRHAPGWRQDARLLKGIGHAPIEEVHAAHQEAKQELATALFERTGAQLDPGMFTLAYARRATSYKRLDLLFRNLDRLAAISERHGPLQIVCGGKAHPADQPGKDAIRRLVEAGGRLGDRVQVVVVPNYEVRIAQHLVAGADVWLNTPVPPMEASGTSGMKAAHNGVPSLSVLDGWWCEGHLEGVTGWSIGDAAGTTSTDRDDEADADSLYTKLEGTILPLFYGDQGGWNRVMRETVARNAAQFNTHRMFREYVSRAYREEDALGS